MSFPIRLTDASEYGHIGPPHEGKFPCSGDREPVIVFLKGQIAFNIVSDPSSAGYGDERKLKYYYEEFLKNSIIELPVLLSNHLEKGRFQVSDGRHRATVFMVRHEILDVGSYGPTLSPEDRTLASTPFLTLNVFATKLKQMDYLDSPCIDFDSSGCSARVFI